MGDVTARAGALQLETRAPFRDFPLDDLLANLPR
jgi:hypothetical protein